MNLGPATVTISLWDMSFICIFHKYIIYKYVIFISKYDTLSDTLETFVKCISEFYLRASVTECIETQMSFLAHL